MGAVTKSGTGTWGWGRGDAYIWGRGTRGRGKGGRRDVKNGDVTSKNKYFCDCVRKREKMGIWGAKISQ